MAQPAVRYRVWVGGLPPDIQKEDLYEKFSKYGAITDVVLRTSERDTYAFVTYPERTEAEEAIARMDRSCAWGAPVKVNISKDFAPTGPRRKTAEGKPINEPAGPLQGLPLPPGWKVPRGGGSPGRRGAASASRSPRQRPSRSSTPKHRRRRQQPSPSLQERGHRGSSVGARDDRRANLLRGASPSLRSATARRHAVDGYDLPHPSLHRDPRDFRDLGPPTLSDYGYPPPRSWSPPPGDGYRRGYYPPLPPGYYLPPPGYARYSLAQEEALALYARRAAYSPPPGRGHSLLQCRGDYLDMLGGSGPSRPSRYPPPERGAGIGAAGDVLPPPAQRDRSPGRAGPPPAGRHRVTIENIPDDMSGLELRDLGLQYGASVASARTYRRGQLAVGVLEFAEGRDARRCTKTLEGRRMEGATLKMRAFHEGG
mmetsp:Transcript_152585/g.489312  ORF Transcript_152585/g.489312 Transcript_152585/m.489312 type:complete len:426 (+) Transcript_152585:70-1347(+)